MFKCSFKNLDELNSFLSEFDYCDVKYCIDPDYIDAIIGISDENKLVYDYVLMVSHLAKIYEAEGESEDPDMDAVEWIDYNCDMPYWEIVTRDDGFWHEELRDEGLEPYFKYFIGVNMHGILLVDSEFVNNYNIDELEEMLKSREIEYKIV